MNVFIVEDSEAVRKSLRDMLAEFPDVSVVGHAEDEAGDSEYQRVAA